MVKGFLAAATAGILVFGGSASAVTVDFEGGVQRALGTSWATFGGEAPWAYTTRVTTGVWQESGVNTYFRMHDNLIEGYGIEPQSFETSYYRNLSESNPGADPLVTERMVVSRSDGGAFDLRRIATGGSYEGLVAYGDFTPEGGTWEDGAVAYFPLLGPSLSLMGRKADGSTVEGIGTTKTRANWIDEDGWPFTFGPMDALIPDETLSVFTNLTDLTVKVLAGFYPDRAAEERAATETFSAFDAPPILLEGIALCGFQSCSVSGLGEFTFFTDVLGGRNDVRNVYIDGFEVDFVGGPGAQPAPVPLPAPALLLLAGLAALTLTARRRPR